MGGSTDPVFMSYDPALARQPGIRFSTLVRDMAPIRQVLLPVLTQLATGCSNPLLRALVISPPGFSLCGHPKALAEANGKRLLLPPHLAIFSDLQFRYGYENS